MIDTNKYENITPERWTVDEEDPCRVVDVQDCTIARTDWVVIHEEREWQLANARLIADAPLLLEEYKRLRELKIAEEDELERLYNHAEFYEGEYNLARRTNQERLAEIKRLREQLAKANKYVYTICQHSDSMLMDYEDYMKGDEEE